ncbi:MAG: hypothetical protein IJW45_06825 [Oscillospiraceae bacterium]|nr:hypothetical protein [Oscillospiraceae bacterium]
MIGVPGNTGTAASGSARSSMILHLVIGCDQLAEHNSQKVGVIKGKNVWSFYLWWLAFWGMKDYNKHIVKFLSIHCY